MHHGNWRMLIFIDGGSTKLYDHLKIYSAAWPMAYGGQICKMIKIYIPIKPTVQPNQAGSQPICLHALTRPWTRAHKTPEKRSTGVDS
jgi:hypothetical protein